MLFDAQDQADKQSDELIAAIEGALKQRTRTEPLFSVRWTIAELYDCRSRNTKWITSQSIKMDIYSS